MRIWMGKRDKAFGYGVKSYKAEIEGATYCTATVVADTAQLAAHLLEEQEPEAMSWRLRCRSMRWQWRCIGESPLTEPTILIFA